MNADLFGLRTGIVVPVIALLALAVTACSDISDPVTADPTPPMAEPSNGVTAAMDVAAVAAPNSWISQIQMPTARAGLVTASVNGVIYAIGGNDADLNPLSTVEAYRPGTNTLVPWVTKAPMPAARRSSHGATVINGKIYVVGGLNAAQEPTRNLFVYDVAGNYWVSKAPMPMASYAGASAAIDGKLYVVATPPGDDGFYSGATRLYRYDPATNTWSARRSAPHNHQGGMARAINGKLYVVGGVTLYWDDAPRPIGHNELEVYNPATNAWITKASMPTTRWGAAAAVLNGKLHVAGGTKTDGSGTSQTSAFEVYNPTTNSWAVKKYLPTPRASAGAGVADGILYVIGGSANRNGALRTNEAYTP